MRGYFVVGDLAYVKTEACVVPLLGEILEETVTTQEIINLNKELTKIINLFKADKNSGYTLLSSNQETKLIIKIQEIERRLGTTIVIEGIYNDKQGY